ncbi:MAG: SagB/ThcOx family dehydrogenase [Anaerolineales bacterium]
MDRMKKQRELLKAHRWDRFADEQTPQRKNEPVPPIQKPYPEDAVLIDLVAPKDLQVGDAPLIEIIRARESHRAYTDETLSLEELSFLLWATQGVREVAENGKFTKRTVPSGGARHAFETYLLIQRVRGLMPGLYRYLPLEHKLYFIRQVENLSEKVSDGCRGQKFVGNAAVVFVWTTVPYRAEWRYGLVSHKMIAMDSGHVCQNLYLACGSISAGTCAVDAYDQAKMDALLGVDGEDEFVIYVAPVGKVA